VDGRRSTPPARNFSDGGPRAGVVQHRVQGRCPSNHAFAIRSGSSSFGNAALNPVTALTGATLGEIGSSPQAKGLVPNIMEECTSVGRAVKDWERFTDEVTRVIDKKPDLVVFVLWGRSPSERRS